MRRVSHAWSLPGAWDGSRVEVEGSSVAVFARARNGERSCWGARFGVMCPMWAEFDVVVEYGPRRDPNRIVGVACSQHLVPVGERLARDQFV